METGALDLSMATQAAAGAVPQATPANELGRDEFLRLLVTKLAHQDPLAPTQDTEFISELATFSSLEQLVGLNSRMDALNGGQAELINAQALTLIGKEALVEAGELRIKGGVPDRLVYSIPSPADHVTLSIQNSTGEVVRTFELQTTPGGRIDLDWDGTDEDGHVLADGDYSLHVEATGPDGEPMAIALFRSLPIDGVNFADGFIQLVSGDRTIGFDTILEIRAGHTP